MGMYCKEETMRIALDAMGSDDRPAPDVAGAVLAARDYGDTILLVGDKGRIEAELAKHDTTGLALEVVHADQVITMDESPSVAGKAKPRSSMHVGMQLVKDGEADGFVTAGNTGAAMVIATLHTLRRIPGVKRPALSSIISFGYHSVIMLDIGANADSRPEFLAQFAIMGDIYARHGLGLENPRVALLSNGEEEGKGCELVHEASSLFKDLPLNFVGNAEPKDLINGSADVVVTDGFTGNIFIKTAEASLKLLGKLIRDEIKSNVLSMAGGALAQPAFRRVFKKLDPGEIGGAPLLGVNGVVIIGHGSSDAWAIRNAIRQARVAAAGNVIQSIQAALEPVKA
jgi:glycerol-3-phosphate acyltransferase PlsX